MVHHRRPPAEDWTPGRARQTATPGNLPAAWQTRAGLRALHRGCARPWGRLGGRTNPGPRYERFPLPMSKAPPSSLPGGRQHQLRPPKEQAPVLSLLDRRQHQLRPPKERAPVLSLPGRRRHRLHPPKERAPVFWLPSGRRHRLRLPKERAPVRRSLAGKHQLRPTKEQAPVLSLLNRRQHRLRLPTREVPMRRLAPVFLCALCLSACRPTATPAGLSPAGSPGPRERVSHTPTFSGPVLPPQVAGRFYPGDPEALRKMVADLLAAAPPGERRPLGLLSPHAGYVFSGPVAAAAYRQAEGQHYDVVVVLGTKHAHAGFTGAAVYPDGALATPLGESVVASDLAAKLVTFGEPIVAERSIFEGEHSVEVQLPFIQTLFPDTAILPIIVASPDPTNVDALGTALAAVVADRQPLLVASSDLSHYPAQEAAVEVDRRLLEAIVSLDADRVRSTIAEQMSRDIPNLSTCACGEGAILAMIATAKRLGVQSASIIDQRTSADSPLGGADEVVGYGAVALWAPEAGTSVSTPGGAKTTPAEAAEPLAAGPLTAAEKGELLRLARQTLEEYLSSQTVPSATPASERLGQKRGAFVTLTRQGELRGCMGSLTAERPLYLQVQQSALMAAVEDPRFPPVTREELDDLHIEISVLGPLEPVTDPSQIEVGKHGLLIEKGLRRGTLLPQVPLEFGWDRDQFLVQLCRKAGLPDDAWRSAKLYRYTAQVFGE